MEWIYRLLCRRSVWSGDFSSCFLGWRRLFVAVLAWFRGYRGFSQVWRKTGLKWQTFLAKHELWSLGWTICDDTARRFSL